MTYTDITPEQAKELIQEAQAEILVQHDEFVDKVSQSSIQEWRELIETEEKDNAEELFENADID